MQPTQKKPLTAFTVISTIILLLLTVLFIFPFYWILTGAFKSQPDTIMIPPQWFPKMPTMENFQQLKTFLWSTHPLCSLYRCHGSSKTSCPCTIGTYRQLHGNSRYSLGSYLAFDRMAVWGLPYETIQ